MTEHSLTKFTAVAPVHPHWRCTMRIPFYDLILITCVILIAVMALAVVML